MRYAQFYIKSVINPDKLIPACGSQAVLKMDGRWRVSRCWEEVFEYTKKIDVEYVACQLFEGETLNRSKPITDIISFDGKVIQDDTP